MSINKFSNFENIKLKIEYSNITDKFIISHFSDSKWKQYCFLELYISNHFNYDDIFINRGELLADNNVSLFKLKWTDYVIIKDEKDPFYKNKKIDLFVNSTINNFIEKKINTGDSTGGENNICTLYNVRVLNNTKPATPKINFDLLLSENKIKNTITKSYLIRLLIDDDFMNEGPNLLLLNIKQSQVGFDITKINNVNNEINENLLLHLINEKSIQDWKLSLIHI